MGLLASIQTVHCYILLPYPPGMSSGTSGPKSDLNRSDLLDVSLDMCCSHHPEKIGFVVTCGHRIRIWDHMSKAFVEILEICEFIQIVF